MKNLSAIIIVVLSVVVATDCNAGEPTVTSITWRYALEKEDTIWHVTDEEMLEISLTFLNGDKKVIYENPKVKQRKEIKKLLRDTWRLRGDNFYDNYYNWLSKHWNEIKTIMEGEQ